MNRRLSVAAFEKNRTETRAPGHSAETLPTHLISSWSRTALVAACAVLVACVGRTPISLGSDAVVVPDTDPSDSDLGDTCSDVSCADRVFVSDAGTPRIQQFDALTGAFVASFTGAGEDVLSQPRGMVLSGGRQLLVVDPYGSKNFKHYQPDGTLLGEIGPTVTAAPPTAPSTMSGTWLRSGGHLWVTDNGNNRVQVLDTDGSRLAIKWWHCLARRVLVRAPPRPPARTSLQDLPHCCAPCSHVHMRVQTRRR